MSTSRIGVLVGKTIKSVFCHWDGMPSHQLPILNGFYNTQELAEQLISMGAIEVLDERISPIGEHSYNEREQGTCLFYHRDMEDDIHIEVNYSERAFFNRTKSWEEYHYLFKNGEWIYILFMVTNNSQKGR